MQHLKINVFNSLPEPVKKLLSSYNKEDVLLGLELSKAYTEVDDQFIWVVFMKNPHVGSTISHVVHPEYWEIKKKS